MPHAPYRLKNIIPLVLRNHFCYFIQTIGNLGCGTEQISILHCVSILTLACPTPLSEATGLELARVDSAFTGPNRHVVQKGQG